MIYKILLIGPQGSGKGTQAERLSKHLGIPCFAMGQLLRDEVASGNEIGQRVASILASGNLVPDMTAAEVLQARLARPDTSNGYILDGYPRNTAQADAFTFDTPTHVLVIEIPREESLRRLGGRLTCTLCSKIVAVSAGFNEGDVCPSCGGSLVRRGDDTDEAIRRRLEIYEQDTQPVIARYESLGLVRCIDGVGSVEEVEARIHSVLGL